MPLAGYPSRSEAIAVPEVESANSGSLCVKLRLNPKSPDPQRNEPPNAFGRISRISAPNRSECLPFTHERLGTKLIRLVVFWLGCRVPNEGYVASISIRGGSAFERAAEKLDGKPIEVASKPL